MKRITTLAFGATTLLLAPLYAATLAGPPPLPNSPAVAAQDEADLAGEVEDIIDEYDEKMAAFWEAYNATEDKAEKNEIYSSSYPQGADYVARLSAVIEKDPSHAAALTAIVWMMEKADVSEQREGFFAIMLEHHVNSDELGKVCSALGRENSQEAEAFLRTVIASSESHDSVGQASYSLSGVLGSRLSLQSTIETLSEEDYANYAGYYGEDVMEFCKGIDTEATKAERKQLLVTVRDKYGDVKTRRGTLGKAAGGQLFEMERLQIGMVAPEIQGDDLDGIDFKLSDYRGQVVFLDFWGDW